MSLLMRTSPPAEGDVRIFGYLPDRHAAHATDLFGDGKCVRIAFERLDDLCAFCFWNHALSRARRERCYKTLDTNQIFRQAGAMIVPPAGMTASCHKAGAIFLAGQP
jgi:hypothetical protein